MYHSLSLLKDEVLGGDLVREKKKLISYSLLVGLNARGDLATENMV